VIDPRLDTLDGFSRISIRLARELFRAFTHCRGQMGARKSGHAGRQVQQPLGFHGQSARE